MPRFGLHEADEHADGRALPRAVRAEEAVDVARAHLQAQVVDRPPPAEVLCQTACLEHDIGHSDFWLPTTDYCFPDSISFAI